MNALPAPMTISSNGWCLEYWFWQLEKKQVTRAPYQRQDYVWSREMQSLLIESFILGYFVPETCLEAANTNQPKTIVDGLQRLSTWFRFRRGELRLKGLEVLPHLNGKRWEDLSPAYQQRLNEYTLRYNILPSGSGQEAFDRLNHTAPLKATERLRSNCDGPAWPTIERLAAHLLEVTSPHRRANLAKRSGHLEHVLWGFLGLLLEWRTFERGMSPELGFGDFPLRRGGTDWRPAWIQACLTKLHSLDPVALRELERRWLETIAIVVGIFGESALGQVRDPKFEQRQRYNGTATVLQFCGVNLVGCGRALERAAEVLEVYQSLPMSCPGRLDLQRTYQKMRMALAGHGLAAPLTRN